MRNSRINLDLRSGWCSQDCVITGRSIENAAQLIEVGRYDAEDPETDRRTGEDRRLAA
jgi:hypothetical protein